MASTETLIPPERTSVAPKETESAKGEATLRQGEGTTRRSFLKIAGTEASMKENEEFRTEPSGADKIVVSGIEEVAHVLADNGVDASKADLSNVTSSSTLEETAKALQQVQVTDPYFNENTPSEKGVLEDVEVRAGAYEIALARILAASKRAKKHQAPSFLRFKRFVEDGIRNIQRPLRPALLLVLTACSSGPILANNKTIDTDGNQRPPATATTEHVLPTLPSVDPSPVAAPSLNAEVTTSRPTEKPTKEATPSSTPPKKETATPPNTSTPDVPKTATATATESHSEVFFPTADMPWGKIYLGISKEDNNRNYDAWNNNRKDLNVWTVAGLQNPQDVKDWWRDSTTGEGYLTRNYAVSPWPQEEFEVISVDKEIHTETSGRQYFKFKGKWLKHDGTTEMRDGFMDIGIPWAINMPPGVGRAGRSPAIVVTDGKLTGPEQIRVGQKYGTGVNFKYAIGMTRTLITVFASRAN